MPRVLAALVGAMIGASMLAGIAFADATPVQLVLIYMPNVSNTGTTAASGIAELVLQEGEVRISATDLPRLDAERTYVAWAVNTEANEFQRLGAFNSALATSTVHYENVLPDAIPNHHWNLLLITVEQNADAPRPSNKHSIAGVFPRADNQPLPILLPNTGGAPDEVAGVRAQGSGVIEADWVRYSGLAALTFVVGAGAGYALGFRKQ